MVLRAIATALGLARDPRIPPFDALRSAVQPRALLLILDNQSANAIAQICRDLEGLSLAIELVAACSTAPTWRSSKATTQGLRPAWRSARPAHEPSGTGGARR